MKITRPTLLIDQAKCKANIAKMVAKAKNADAILRPHFKTHHSATIASWYKEAGIEHCTVASVSMAQYFAENGWEDITIAFPYNPLEADAVNELAKSINLNILIESEESLSLAKEKIENEVGYFIKIDVGTHRTGIDHRNEELLSKLIEGASDKLKFQGFLAHAGHTYGAKGTKNIEWLFEGAKKMLIPLREKFGGLLSYGDTPSCSSIDDLSMFDVLRPGNFIFYDWMQKEIGSCTLEEIAVCMAAPVVAKHPERSEVVVHCGAVHLSKDSLGNDTEKTFGKVVDLKENGWDHEIIGDVVRLSQEHGILRLDQKKIEQMKIGDLIGIIPVHSCLTADLQGHYLSTNGERIDKIIKN